MRHIFTLTITLPLLAPALPACDSPDDEAELQALDIEDDVEVHAAQDKDIADNGKPSFEEFDLEANVRPAAYYPHQGHLCQATENIQFYADDFSTPSYVVQQNQYIRIDWNGETLVNWAYGHGDGHSSRSFIYRHSNGVIRLKNCH